MLRQSLMFKPLFCGAALAVLAIAGPAQAQSAPPDAAPRAPLTIERQTVTIPGTDYEVVYHSPAGSPAAPSRRDGLLTAIETWLSAAFDLPATHDHPRIVLAPAATMAALRYRSLLSAASVTAQHDVMGLYVDAENTIYLPQDWTGDTPGELSVLVHEMVHHLQKLGGLTYECPQGREKLAYVAQNRWLWLSGQDLASEFAIDPFSLLVKTNCGY
jgi:hypothetical protein